MLLFFLKNLQKNGISTEIYSLINNEEIRPSANIVISKCSAYDYLNNSIPNIEKMTVKYYDTFSITSRFTGYITNITIGDFYNNFSSPDSDSTAILGGLNATARKENESSESSLNGSSESDSSSGSSSSSGSGSGGSSDSGGSETINSQESSLEDTNVITNPEELTAGTSSVMGNRGTENIGIAVFKEDKLCGELTATESICHLLIGNAIDSCIITIDSPLIENKKMELQLIPSKKSKISVDIKDNKIYASVNIKLDADILTLEDGINYEETETLNKVSIAAEEYLKSEFNDYLNKISKEYETDIDHFCVKALSHFVTNSEWESFNWKEKFKNAEFDVHIDVNTISSLLVTKT